MPRKASTIRDIPLRTSRNMIGSFLMHEKLLVVIRFSMSFCSRAERASSKFLDMALTSQNSIGFPMMWKKRNQDCDTVSVFIWLMIV